MTQSSKLKVQRAHSQAISLYPIRFSTVMTQSSKLKVHRAHSQAISWYTVRFSRYTLFFSFFLSLFFFKKLEIYIMIHIWLSGLVSDKNIFTQPISGNKITFFASLLEW